MKNPIDLKGRWLFTRLDKPENKDAKQDTSSWVQVEVPGSWRSAYPDSNNFSVAWYYGKFSFDSKLKGRKAVLYLNAEMSRIRIYLDGEEVFRRSGLNSYERYYALQPIAVVIPISAAEHVVTMRIESRLMEGISQAPFQLRAFKKQDIELSFSQWWFEDFRLIAAALLFLLAGLFLWAYFEYRESIFYFSALTSLAALPLFLLPYEGFVHLVTPEKLRIAYYSSFLFLALAHVRYSEALHGFQSRASRLISGAVYGLMTISFLLMLKFNLYIFLAVRGLIYLGGLGLVALASWNCYKALYKNPRLTVVLLGELVFLVISFYEMLLGFGVIQTSSLLFLGAVIASAAVVYFALHAFAEQLLQTKQLLRHVEQLNQNLETVAKQRGSELSILQKNYNVVLQNVPEGVLTFDASFSIQGDYSLALEQILETQHIEGRDIFQLLFAYSSVVMDVEAQMRCALDLSFGESELNFEVNQKLLVQEFRTIIRKKTKVLSLSWNPMFNDDSTLIKIILTIVDVSRLKRLERDGQWSKISTNLLELASKGILKAVHDRLKASQKSFETFLQQLREDRFSDGEFQQLLADMVVLRSNARTFELHALYEVVQQLESELLEMRRRTESIKGDQIQFILKELVDILQRLDGFKSELLSKFDAKDSEDLLDVHPKLWHLFKARWQNFDLDSPAGSWAELQGDLKSLSYISAKTHFAELVTSCNEIASRLGKSLPDVHLNVVDDLFVDPRLLQLLHEIILALFSQSLEQSFTQGKRLLSDLKNERGQIYIRIRPQGNAFILDYSDDGRGLNLELLSQRAGQSDVPDLARERPDQIVAVVLLQAMVALQGSPDAAQAADAAGMVLEQLRAFRVNMRWNQAKSIDAKTRFLAFDISFMFPSGSLFLAAKKSEIRRAL